MSPEEVEQYLQRVSMKVFQTEDFRTQLDTLSHFHAKVKQFKEYERRLYRSTDPAIVRKVLRGRRH